jgi:POT family proton-dependent oligopeptide transporter
MLQVILSWLLVSSFEIVLWKVGREFAAVGTEVPATWFGILNSLFIVCFAPVFKMVGKSVQSFWTNEVWSWNDFTRFRFGSSGSMGINPNQLYV